MRKGWMVLLALALVVALAAPASAEMKLTGFYRVKPTLSNFVGNGNNNLNAPGTESSVSLGKDTTAATVDTNRTRSFTEMRNRLRFEFGDENVKGVTFFELDGVFGDTGGQTGRNQGFASNGDSINLETKNAYVWFKVPNTSLDFTVGLQGYMDEFAGLLFGASDQAGVVANFKGEPVAVRLTWLKLRDDVGLASPGTGYSRWTSNNAGNKSADYYAVDAKLKPTKDVAATFHVGYINDRGQTDTTLATFVSAPTEAAGYSKLDAYYLGANATFNAGPANLTAFALYNFGKFKKAGSSDVDISGFAVAARADVAAGPGKAFLEALYVSGDDDRSTGNTKYKSIVTGSDYANLTSYYFRPDLTILFPNIDMINSATALVLNPSNNGRGLILVAGGFSMKLGDKMTGKVGAGYLTADKKRKSAATTEAKGKAMGTEINANVNYNITKGLDFGVYGAYAMLGKFYDRDAPAKNPDDLYTMHGRLNYAF